MTNFEKRLRPDAFLDWVERVDHHFEWKGMSEDKVKFVSLKLKGHTPTGWPSPLECPRAKTRLGRGSAWRRYATDLYVQRMLEDNVKFISLKLKGHMPTGWSSSLDCPREKIRLGHGSA